MMPRDRAQELLADRATGDLAPADRVELDRLLSEEPSLAGDEGFERAAAALAVGLVSSSTEAMPAEVRSRVLARMREVASSPLQLSGTGPSRAQSAGILPRPEVRTLPRWMPYAGWIAAAAAVALAAVAWWPFATKPVLDGRAEFLRLASDIKQAEWSAWDNPEVPGVSGRVEWSESLQRGYMVFSGLRPNDPASEQYQLWIIDARGMEQRISGAIFDAAGTGEVIVPITPGIAVRGAAAFAVTIEKPGGVWVSDMKRRVVIAPIPG